MRGRSVLVLLLISLLLAAAAGMSPARGEDRARSDVPVIPVTVIATYPHDVGSFTQGLAISDGVLYEGTGWYGESRLRRVDLTTGNALQEVPLSTDLFGEGIAVIGNQIAQLTWQSHIGFVYDRESFALLGTFSYPTEGWGLTFDGARLVLSDGSETLRFLDPDTFAEVGQIRVHANGRPVSRLNELEYVDGLVLANVWQSDQIAVIMPGAGAVCSWLDLSGLNPLQQANRNDVLNGIAFDADARRLFVTGKRWPTLYEIALDPELIRPCA